MVSRMSSKTASPNEQMNDATGRTAELKALT